MLQSRSQGLLQLDSGRTKQEKLKNREETLSNSGVSLRPFKKTQNGQDRWISEPRV